MAPPPGPYSGTSTLALVARASAFSFGLVYGSIKLKYLKSGNENCEWVSLIKEWNSGEKGKGRKELEDLLDASILAKDSNGETALSVEEIIAQCTSGLSHSTTTTEQ
ncbi:hypothetical protein PTKIN_Ptkin02bG0202500 [Pterospermum kingtungense]